MAFSAAPTNLRARPRPIMNVTPLVDVVLVLLIIFMVVIPAMEQGLNIVVPGIFNIDAKTDEKAKPFMLSLTKDGKVYLDEESVPWPALENRLRQVSRSQPNRRLVLRGDNSVPYGKVRSLYKSVQEVGFPGVSLRVNHRKGEGEGR
jgi:biopolymer transport protein ExbD/biopolymer transport protein TolR